ncbi:MAG: prepilin-type N-terminal cleavage/methylation domain-containing protein [bacterium]
MKRNNKGFTLIELLAVIVIISIVSTIAGTGVIAIRKAINANLLDSKIDIIESGAILWGQDNLVLLSNTTTSCIDDAKGFIKKLSDLSDYVIGNDLCEVEERNTTTGVMETVQKSCIQNNLTGLNMEEDRVCIYYKNNRVYAKYDETSPSYDE